MGVRLMILDRTHTCERAAGQGNHCKADADRVHGDPAPRAPDQCGRHLTVQRHFVRLAPQQLTDVIVYLSHLPSPRMSLSLLSFSSPRATSDFTVPGWHRRI